MSLVLDAFILINCFGGASAVLFQHPGYLIQSLDSALDFNSFQVQKFIIKM